MGGRWRGGLPERQQSPEVERLGTSQSKPNAYPQQLELLTKWGEGAFPGQASLSSP